MTEESRETLLKKAMLYEQAEMHDDMLSAMRKLASLSTTGLDNTERKLFSNAHKNVVGKKRTAWRAISLVEQKLVEADNPKKDLVRRYSANIVDELRKDCEELLALLENHVIPKSSEPESKVFFLKMKGDYLRYLVEVSSSESGNGNGNGNGDDDEKEKSKRAYLEAIEVSEKDLAVAHPYRLGLALNFSVFQFEIENCPEKAYELAKKAFDDAIPELDNLKEEEIEDATTIMQLLRDNLTFWNEDWHAATIAIGPF